LGVPFSSSGLFNEAASHFTSAGNIALSSTLKVVSQLKVSSAKQRDVLLNSLVLNVVLYGAPIWAIRHINDLEKLQLNFHKRAYGFKKNIPNYMVILELDLKHIGWRVLKAALGWLNKVAHMEDFRYPKQCLQLLRHYDNNNKISKYNWLSNIKKLIKYYCPNSDLNTLNNINRSTKNEILNMILQSIKNQDINSATTLLPPLHNTTPTLLAVNSKSL
jgi:hypothetical protein